MDFEKVWEEIAAKAPDIGMGLLYLLGAVVLGLVLTVVIRGAFKAAGIDRKMAQLVGLEATSKQAPRVGHWVSLGVFWLVVLYGLLMFFDSLKLTEATRPLNELLFKITGYVPQLLGALVLIVVAFVIARLARFAVVKALAGTKLDQKVRETAGKDGAEMALSTGLGTAVYALVLLVFLLPVLQALGLYGLLAPVSAMMGSIFLFLPRLVVAAVIVLVGWFVAKLVRQIVTQLAESAGLDRLGDRTGLSKVGKGTLSALVGTIVYVLILVTALTMALDKLALDAVSEPLQAVLDDIAQAVPKLLVASVVLVVAWVIGKVVAGIVSDLLARLGFDRLFVVLGLSRDVEDGGAAAEDVPPPSPVPEQIEQEQIEPGGAERPDAAKEAWTPSRVVGQVVLVAVMLMAITTATEQLGFEALTERLDALVDEGASWFRALLFLGLGLWVANFTHRVIRARETANSAAFATVARIAIIVLAAAVALGEVEVGKGIVEQAFGYAIGGLAFGAALAFGLSFGLGGRDAASRRIDRWEGGSDSE